MYSTVQISSVKLYTLLPTSFTNNVNVHYISTMNEWKLSKWRCKASNCQKIQIFYWCTLSAVWPSSCLYEKLGCNGILVSKGKNPIFLNQSIHQSMREDYWYAYLLIPMIMIILSLTPNFLTFPISIWPIL